MTTLSDFQALSIDGRAVPLAQYAGQVVLVVNTASACGFTPQFEGLQSLHQRYAAQGLAVLGFPCNQFGAQDKGSNAEIGAFCQKNYGVDFPMMEKVKVNGRGEHPLYTELKKATDADGKAGRVKWNLEKFVITPGGAVHRFRPTTEPDAPEVVAVIEEALAG